MYLSIILLSYLLISLGPESQLGYGVVTARKQLLDLEVEQAQEFLANAMSLNSICNQTVNFIGTDRDAIVTLMTDREGALSLLELISSTSNIFFKKQLVT